MTQTVDAPPAPPDAATPTGRSARFDTVRDAGVVRIARDVFARVRRAVTPALSTVTPVGWAVFGIGVAAWIIGGRFGWIELRTIGFAAILLFGLCVLLTLGRTLLKVEVDLEPHRVVVGEPATGRVRATNVSKVRLLASVLELPIGEGGARFSLPSLASDESHDEVFVVPTLRRAVIPVGPAMTVRGDPLGLFRRKVPWTERTDLFVHPLTVPLESLGSGLLRDLEGQTTNDLSMSDLAFHALREYAPGDDRRHIHWKSSAKISSAQQDGKFMVRQFLDTRRSHLTVVVDGHVDAYRSADDFELAASAAASIAVRAIRDDMETTVLVADQVSDEESGQQTLDRFSAASFGGGAALSALAATAALLAPDTSVALIITGANTDFGQLRRASLHFPTEANTFAMRIDPSVPVGVTDNASLPVLSLPHLGDLGALLRGGVLR